MQKIKFKDLGILRYKEALDVQLEHFESIKKLKIQNRDNDTNFPTPNFFFLCSTPTRIYYGKKW